MWPGLAKFPFFLFLGIAVAACSTTSQVGPVPIYPEDRCTACGMHILDTRYASEAVLTSGKVLKFDDMGEMFSYLRAKGLDREQIRAIFVQDFQTREWLKGEEAHFVVAEEIHTPMGSGVIAFASYEQASTTAERFHGHVATFQDMVSGK